MSFIIITYGIYAVRSDSGSCVARWDLSPNSSRRLLGLRTMIGLLSWIPPGT